MASWATTVEQEAKQRMNEAARALFLRPSPEALERLERAMEAHDTAVAVAERQSLPSKLRDDAA